MIRSTLSPKVTGIFTALIHGLFTDNVGVDQGLLAKVVRNIFAGDDIKRKKIIW